MVRYKSVLLGVRHFKTKEKVHGSLLATKKHILRSIKPGSHRPAWIVRVENGKERILPGQYEVHDVLGTGKVGLFIRRDKPNRLSRTPVLTM